MTDYLFVYGTLGRNAGHEMHRHLIRHADYAGEGWFNGRLYSVAHYPGAVTSSDPNDKVYGELYRLREASDLFRELDAYEGCGPGDPQRTLYVRQAVMIHRSGGEAVRAWIYLYNRDVGRLTRITSGRFTEGKRG